MRAWPVRRVRRRAAGAGRRAGPAARLPVLQGGHWRGRGGGGWVVSGECAVLVCCLTLCPGSRRACAVGERGTGKRGGGGLAPSAPHSHVPAAAFFFSSSSLEGRHGRPAQAPLLPVWRCWWPTTHIFGSRGVWQGRAKRRGGGWVGGALGPARRRPMPPPRQQTRAAPPPPVPTSPPPRPLANTTDLPAPRAPPPRPDHRHGHLPPPRRRRLRRLPGRHRPGRALPPAPVLSGGDQTVWRPRTGGSPPGRPRQRPGGRAGGPRPGGSPGPGHRRGSSV